MLTTSEPDAHTGPFPCNAEWEGLVATLESALRLHHHEPGES
jgi:hypothetical protein